MLTTDKERVSARIPREQTIVLTAADTERFFAALERPPAPNAALRRAARAYRRSALLARD